MSCQQQSLFLMNQVLKNNHEKRKSCDILNSSFSLTFEANYYYNDFVRINWKCGCKWAKKKKQRQTLSTEISGWFDFCFVWLLRQPTTAFKNESCLPIFSVNKANVKRPKSKYIDKHVIHNKMWFSLRIDADVSQPYFVLSYFYWQSNAIIFSSPVSL